MRALLIIVCSALFAASLAKAAPPAAGAALEEYVDSLAGAFKTIEQAFDEDSEPDNKDEILELSRSVVASATDSAERAQLAKTVELLEQLFSDSANCKPSATQLLDKLVLMSLEQNLVNWSLFFTDYATEHFKNCPEQFELYQDGLSLSELN